MPTPTLTRLEIEKAESARAAHLAQLATFTQTTDYPHLPAWLLCPAHFTGMVDTLDGTLALHFTLDQPIPRHDRNIQTGYVLVGDEVSTIFPVYQYDLMPLVIQQACEEIL